MVVLNVGLIIMKRNAAFKNKLINDTRTVSRISIYTALVLFGILILAYLISSDEILGSYEKYEITASTAKWVGIGLSSFYILAIGAVGAVLYAELSKIISK